MNVVARAAAPASKASATRTGDAKARSGKAKPAKEEGGAFDAESAPVVKGAGRANNRNRTYRSREGARPPKREFDRHDGTGRGHEDKKQGGGAHNWGTEGEEAKEAVEKVNIEEDVNENGKEEEEEEVQMSLEEYEAQQAEKRAALRAQKESAYKPDNAQFQGMKPHEKVEDDAGISLLKNAKHLGANKTGREKELKTKEVVTNVGFRVSSEVEARPRTERSGRGGSKAGRGGGRSDRRGGGARGGARTGRGERSGRGAPIHINDSMAFPSLG